MAIAAGLFFLSYAVLGLFLGNMDDFSVRADYAGEAVWGLAFALMLVFFLRRLRSNGGLGTVGLWLTVTGGVLMATKSAALIFAGNLLGPDALTATLAVFGPLFLLATLCTFIGWGLSGWAALKRSRLPRWVAVAMMIVWPVSLILGQYCAALVGLFCFVLSSVTREEGIPKLAEKPVGSSPT